MRQILLITLFILLFSGMNIIYAQLSVDPDGVAASMEAAAQAEIEMVVTNSGDEDVPFKIKVEGIDLAEEENERIIPPRRDDRSDPDDMDYEWRDNDEDDGPEFEWIDIREWDDVEDWTIQDDGNTGSLDLGFVFPFWNREFDQVYFSSDGWMSFTYGGQDYDTYRDVPNYPMRADANAEHGNTIVAYGMDHTGTTDLWYWTSEDDYAVLMWHGNRTNWLEIVLYDNGLAKFQYGNNNGQAVNIGVNLGDGEHGWCMQQGVVPEEGYAIGFGPPQGWVTWIIPDPEEGVIEANSEQEITLQLNTEGLDDGYYYSILQFVDPEDNDIIMLELPAILSVNTPVYNITGIVTDAGNDNVVDDALVTITPYDIKRGSNNDGEYEFTNLHLGEYEFLFTAPDFLPHTETVEIDDEGDYELNVELLHSECTPSERQFTMQLEPGDTHEFEFQIDNDGNGPLTYTVDRRLLGDANAEPFELRQTDEIQDACGDDMLAGAVFAEDRFFISGGNNGNNPNKIYVLNTDMEVVNEFDQFVDDRYGMRDLAYDGELIWGAVEGTFYGFTTAGDLEIEFSVDANLEGRALAWDPVDEVLLASDISTDIFAINRDGDVVETYRRPAELRIYGLGVWPDDPDDCYLYVFCRGPDNVGIDAFKVNPATGEYMLAQYFDVGDGRPSGIMITNQLDVYSWVIVSLVQNPDRLNIWQLAARKEWFQITPTAGVIEPDEHEGFVLTLDATGLPTDNDFRGEVVFMHDGIGSETALDVTLSVVEGRVQTTRDIDLHIGWNTISTNLQPNDNENIEGLVAAIVDSGAMIMMKNTNGDFYRPAYDFNNIQAWNSWEGFQMLMAEAATLTIAGESVLKEDPIDLTEGWQLVSYYPRYEIEATEALASIYDHLIIA
ncbi:carboxypeptidase-like regulatory domain-containing protein, partial [bacterium]|nr:carboxypeptidase-like regulatory domain-containing protein [bacterium]